MRRQVWGIETPAAGMVADGLKALAGIEDWTAAGPRILTPHPGEMARLTGLGTDEVQADRVGVARAFAIQKRVTLVLKGHRTVIALPNGEVYVNPSGTPALATGGTGDILTGMIAGLCAQFPVYRDEAVVAAVWLHGRAGRGIESHLHADPRVFPARLSRRSLPPR